MAEDNEQILLLETMAENEDKIRELYDQYSLNFSEYSDFWSKIADEERVHALWLRAFKNDVLSGKSVVDKDRFNLGAVSGFSKYLNEKIGESRKAKLLLPQAIVMSLDIERGLIEKDFFNIIKTDSEDLKNILNNLYKETLNHIKRIENLQKQLNAI
jgi:hypothetical protein